MCPRSLLTPKISFIISICENYEDFKDGNEVNQKQSFFGTETYQKLKSYTCKPKFVSALFNFKLNLLN